MGGTPCSQTAPRADQLKVLPEMSHGIYSSDYNLALKPATL